MRVAKYVIKDSVLLEYWTGYGWSVKQRDAFRYGSRWAADDAVLEAKFSPSASLWANVKVVRLK